MEAGDNLFGMRNQGCGISFAAAGQETSHQTGRQSLLKANFCIISLQTIIIAQKKRPCTAEFQYKYYKLKNEKHEKKKIGATYIHLYKHMCIYTQQKHAFTNLCTVKKHTISGENKLAHALL